MTARIKRIKPLKEDDILEMVLGQKMVCQLLASVSSIWIDALESLSDEPQEIEENKRLREAWRIARRLKRKKLL